MKTSLLLLTFGLVFLTACDRSDTGPRVANIERRLLQLESNAPPSFHPKRPFTAIDFLTDAEPAVPSVETRLAGLSNRVGWLEMQEFNQNAAKSRAVTLDPTSKQYLRVDTDVLPLFISTKEFSPYLDGYKIHLAIGNPHNVAFIGFKLHVNWGISLIVTNSVAINFWEYERSRKHADFLMTETLYSGAWTPIEFTLAPATVDEIRNVEVSIDANEIRLREKP